MQHSSHFIQEIVISVVLFHSYSPHTHVEIGFGSSELFPAKGILRHRIHGVTNPIWGISAFDVNWISVELLLTNMRLSLLASIEKINPGRIWISIEGNCYYVSTFAVGKDSGSGWKIGPRGPILLYKFPLSFWRIFLLTTFEFWNSIIF